jgi:hypothetical protein
VRATTTKRERTGKKVYQCPERSLCGVQIVGLTFRESPHPHVDILFIELFFSLLFRPKKGFIFSVANKLLARIKSE